MTRRRAWILGAGGCAAVVILGGALLVLLAAQPVTPAVTTVQATMARALDARFNPLDPTGIFLPGETFYLSVRVEGAPANSMVTARWVYDGTPITQQDQALGGSEAAYVLGFELRRTDALWPTGNYGVELLLNGQLAGEVGFVVRQPG